MGFHAGIAGFHGGRAGVDVFFVISGFLITTLLLVERDRSGRIGLGAFYMRRVLRLYPALLAAVAGALLLAYLKMPVFDASSASFDDTLEGTPFALFYTMNLARAADWSSGGFLGHTWSLAIEEQFYLVWPVVVILVLRRRRARAARLGGAGLRSDERRRFVPGSTPPVSVESCCTTRRSPTSTASSPAVHSECCGTVARTWWLGRGTPSPLRVAASLQVRSWCHGQKHEHLRLPRGGRRDTGGAGRPALSSVVATVRRPLPSGGCGDRATLLRPVPLPLADLPVHRLSGGNSSR